MLITTLILIIIILFSFALHEFSHAWVANRLGDPTAKMEGRLSFNPMNHWDPIGTTMLVGLIFLQGIGVPVFVFGWGKPVPVDERNFRDPKTDSLKTALAGPASNILIAVILALLLRFAFPAIPLFTNIIILSITINIFLAVFNLIPVPPLDGSRILRSILPEESYWQLEQLSPFLIIGLLTFLLAFPGLLSSIVNQIIHVLVP